MKRYIGYIIRSEEKRVEHFLKLQIRDGRRPDRGLVEGRIIDVKPTVYVMAAAIALYLNPDSRFYRSKELREAMEEAADAFLRLQRDNGFFDFPVCNFYSAPDTAFCFKRLYAGYRLMVKYGDRADMSSLREKYLRVMHGAADAICTGGFHTPNHRWAICAALSASLNLFPEDEELCERMRARRAQYLQEGIDCNADGEYAERSTGNYNAVVNNAMISLYVETGEPSFMEYAARNLRMMLAYIEPDDTIFTHNSLRQDKGRKEYAEKYFYQYLYAAAQAEGLQAPGSEAAAREQSTDKEGQRRAWRPDERTFRLFDAAAHKIIHDNMARGDEAPDCLHLIMLHDEMMEYEFKGYGFEKEVSRFFAESGVVRVRNERYSYTLMRGNSAFLYMNADGLEVYLKIGEAYCDIRNFIPQTLTHENGVSVLETTYGGWYYEPWEEKPETSDWWSMDHSRRRRQNTSTLTTRVTVRELEDGLSVDLETEGLDRLPLRLELCVPAGVLVENGHFCMTAGAGGEMIVRDENIRLHGENGIITFGPCFGEHEFPGHYSNEEPNTDGFTVYCNAYTPVKRSFTIRSGRH